MERMRGGAGGFNDEKTPTPPGCSGPDLDVELGRGERRRSGGVFGQLQPDLDS